MEPKQVDGAKLKQLREAAGHTQEVLAKLSNVAVRTLQRAEKGEKLTRENLADISAALKVSVQDLLQAAVEQAESEAKAQSASPVVVLRKTTSARRVMDLMSHCYRADISCDVEADADNVDVLAALVTALEAHAPDPTPEWGPAFQKSNLADRIRAIASLNDWIARASEMGVSLFVGSYVMQEVVPRYLHDDGVWVTSFNQEAEPVRIGLLLISNDADDRIVRDHPANIPF